MAKRDYAWILLAITFVIVFIGAVASAAGDLFEIYKPRKRRSKHPQRSQKKEKQSQMDAHASYTAKAKDILQEKKEYEDDDVKSSNINGKYYNALPNNVSDDIPSTETMAYFLEIESRLNHLKSQLTTKSGQSLDSIQISDYYKSVTDDKPRNMMTQIHVNNMKLIECMIQNAIYCKSHTAVSAEENKDFYSKLTGAFDTNWSRSMSNKKKQSIRRKIYRNIDFVVEFMGERFMKSLFSAFYIITMKFNSNALKKVAAAWLLYCSGALFYCIENGVNVSMIAYQTGVVLVFMVIIIGYLFSISSVKRNSNSFTTAVILSVIMGWIALRYISYYFNVTASFILILAIFLSYQYKHGPIFANQRNLDEIWICLLVNCGLPLFAYYLQCPEMTKWPETRQEIPQIEIEEVVVEGITDINDNEIETWFMYSFNMGYDLLSWFLTFLWNDFWNMMDITYALDAGGQETQSVCPQIQDEAIPEVAEVVVEATEYEIDDSLYWFNKIFYVFPYPLFNIILISWFVTHSTILIRNISIYKTVNGKLLYCVEIMLSYVLSVVFWYNGMFDSMLFYLMILTIPWTLGLLKYIWEHNNILNDPTVSQHAFIYNLWFFIAIYLSFIYDWISQTGIIYALFSPNLLIAIAPSYFIIQNVPILINEFVWATDF